MRFIVYMFAGLAGGILGGMGMGGAHSHFNDLLRGGTAPRAVGESHHLSADGDLFVAGARQARAFGYARHRLYHIARARSVRCGRSVGQPYRRRGAAKGIRHLFMPVVGMAVHLRVKEHCRQEAGRRRAILSGNSLQAWGKVVKYQATSYQKTEQRIGG